MTLEPGHLVERVAERLRGIGGLTTPPPPPERPIRATPDPTAPAAPSPLDEAAAGSETAAAQPIADAAVAPNDETAHTPGFSPETMLARVVADAPPGIARAAAELAQQRPGEALAPLAPLELEALERAGLVVGRKLRTRISEEFRVTVGTIMRSLKTSYTPGRGAGNLLMVTSSRPGEGKSFTALNLAGSIAQHTQREVLLVDMDAKQHSLSDQLGLGDRDGLIDLAANSAMRIEDTVVRTAIPTLSFLPVGTRRGEMADTGEATVARPMTSLIERLGRRFPNHLVILDAPPCLSTSDPSTIASFVGQIVLVVEAERTQKSEVLASLDLIKACQTVTLMLNKIRVTTSYTFGAYHYFGTYS
ncbi:MAG: hypothetical protein BGP12_22530 [Rhodospirillales bacterium 70-18]|nr:MAG: hypothetical protein BGP12_22530 [Rhodospirillales bacterium 70-18]